MNLREFWTASATVLAIVVAATNAMAANQERVELKDGWKIIRESDKCSVKGEYTDGSTIVVTYNEGGQMIGLNLGIDYARYFPNNPDHLFIDFDSSLIFAVKRKDNSYHLEVKNGADLVSGIINGRAMNLGANNKIAAIFSLAGSKAALDRGAQCAANVGAPQPANDDLSPQERSELYQRWKELTASENFTRTGGICRNAGNADAIMKCAGGQTLSGMKRAADFAYQGCLARRVASPTRCQQIRDTGLSAVTDWLAGR